MDGVSAGAAAVPPGTVDAAGPDGAAVVSVGDTAGPSGTDADGTTGVSVGPTGLSAWLAVVSSGPDGLFAGSVGVSGAAVDVSVGTAGVSAGAVVCAVLPFWVPSKW